MPQARQGSGYAAHCVHHLRQPALLDVAGGRHATALTVDGKVFSWGEGDDGKLGHFSRM